MSYWRGNGLQDMAANARPVASCGALVAATGTLLERLPLNYDQVTLDTIKRIDVLWLKGRAIRRAFEVEHSTAIYSGLLRMADLCALLPNINVSLHIVAPESRREKVFQEITRPVFSLFENFPLSERCTYLSYGSVEELGKLEYLPYPDGQRAQ